MALSITRAELWAAEIEDQAGGLASKLDGLSEAGANLEFVFARRSPEDPGKGVVFVTPLKGARQKLAAKKLQFQLLERIGVVRIEGNDSPGLSARITAAIAAKKLSLRGFSGSTIGRRVVIFVAFDSKADAIQAQRTLKKSL